MIANKLFFFVLSTLLVLSKGEFIPSATIINPSATIINQILIE